MQLVERETLQLGCVSGTSEDELTKYRENVVINLMGLNSNEVESTAIAKKLLSVALSRPSKS
jgi:hypothetical protein